MNVNGTSGLVLGGAEGENEEATGGVDELRESRS